MDWHAAETYLAALDAAARRVLLGVLTSPAEVHAAAIGRLPRPRRAPSRCSQLADTDVGWFTDPHPADTTLPPAALPSRDRMRGQRMTVDVLRPSAATHEFRPRCLKAEIERLLDERGDFGRGLLVHALVALLHDIDHGRCPRCQGPLRTVEDEVPVGSRVTSCRCIPLCAACSACEASERSVRGHSSVLDWYGNRAVRHDLELDLEGIGDASRTFVIDTEVRARAHLGGAPSVS